MELGFSVPLWRMGVLNTLKYAAGEEYQTANVIHGMSWTVQKYLKHAPWVIGSALTVTAACRLVGYTEPKERLIKKD